MASSLLVSAGAGFAGWQPLNDTIMGGSSQADCQATSEGLLLVGYVEPQGGGFVSCRSPVYAPPLDLSAYGALELELDGDGRRFKLAIACRDGV
ncbi:MAG: CIA30 family protein, partial [Synechococcaceae bacterium WB9_2_170]|nr:CIA30 family protein [Synechococcaceae bacterium WB9_2_170]